MGYPEGNNDNHDFFVPKSESRLNKLYINAMNVKQITKRHTFDCIESCVAIQTLHFLKAKLTPILNPPISWAANVSAKKATTVPQNSVSDPLIDTKSPSYSGYDAKNIIIMLIVHCTIW